MRLSRKVALPLDLGIDYQVPVGFAPQTGCRTGVKVASRLPRQVNVGTTSGTVPGTVLVAISGASK